MITYPITPPNTPKPTATSWYQILATTLVASPYTGQAQSQVWADERWGVSVVMDPMTREEAQPWMAFLTSLMGQVGSFYFGDTLLKDPLGTASGSPKVNGANQAGYEIITDGWTPSTLVLKAGDFFSVDNKIYRTLIDVTSDSSGNATVDIWPRAKTPADNSSLIVSGWQGIFRVSEPKVIVADCSRSHLFVIDFKAEEVA